MNDGNFHTIYRSQLLFPILPLELRELIYSYVIRQPHEPTGPLLRLVTDHYTTPTCPALPPPWFPHLCSVNRATKIEAGLWFIRNTNFEIMYTSALNYFGSLLDTFPEEQGWGAVRRLYFSLFMLIHSRSDDGLGNTYLRFMMSCTELVEVTLKFHVRKLLRMKIRLGETGPLPTVDEVRENNHLLSLEEVVQIYQLNDIFGTRELNMVHLDVLPRIRLHYEGDTRGILLDAMALFEELAQWLRDGFAGRGRKVEIVVREVFTEGSRWTGEPGFVVRR
jgi:hypothetical protein